MLQLFFLSRVFLTIAGCVFIAACGDGAKTSDKTPATAEDSPQDSLTIALVGADSLSVFELLQQSHNVDYQSTVMGVFVKAIDSTCSSDHYFWVYSVNGTMAKTAADKCITLDGDTVVWHFRRVGQ